MDTKLLPEQDVMQVCRNGHVITDLLRTCPERSLTHCDRCGAVTMDRCQTCGHQLPGAFIVPGLQPVGARPAPHFCSMCGAAFPWTRQRRPPKRESLALLENLLRRLPRVIRQIRVRHSDRPPFRVTDERDLEDLLRALLPLHFDDIRPECRTPSYSAITRTDYLLAPESIALTIKLAQPRILEQVPEDTAYYRCERKCRTLVVFVYDPESTLRELCLAPTTSAEDGVEPEVRCAVCSS
ncbi:MAG TPA: DUF2321 domain-containing protein [Gemmataceae bacterium]|nr:DUF2321 domain-containing protein [Gemmataceae bacterium]